MSVLTLVRHGQASYLDADYDKLSPLGEEQARRLGAYWRDRGTTFDLVFCGPRRRHARTVEIAAGPDWPAPIVLDEIDEYPAMEVMTTFIPILGKRHPHILDLVAAFTPALPFDSDAAASFARIVAQRRRAGRPISQADAMIAAIAKSHGAALATRNTDDFAGCGVALVNPWTE